MRARQWARSSALSSGEVCLPAQMAIGEKCAFVARDVGHLGGCGGELAEDSGRDGFCKLRQGGADCVFER